MMTTPKKIISDSKRAVSSELEQFKAARKIALHSLSRREYGRQELADKLTQAGHNSEIITLVIKQLAEENWQDDCRYAESYTRSRANKGFGPVRIAYELRQKGIDAEVIAEIVNPDDMNWPDLLAEVYRKKYRQVVISDAYERAKRIRFLQQRGFPGYMINDLLA